MAEPRKVVPNLLVIACFSRHPSALDWARERLKSLFGPIDLASPDFDFHHTKYYEAAMGTDLRKRLLVFHDLVDPELFSQIKLKTNNLEQELAGSGAFPEARPLNIDPGLLQLGKFLLATTKDQAHRIYLAKGIYAEVTLRFQDGAFEPWPWTYADYREPEIREFLKEARDFYRRQLATLSGPDELADKSTQHY